MMHAYDEESLDKAMDSLGEMMEYVTLDLEIPAEEFYQWFLICGLADRFGKGETTVVNGMSGVELAREVIWRTKREEIEVPPALHIDKEAPYWAGWAVAYYQWYRAIPFSRIEKVVPFQSIVGMYHPFHEMDITQFADAMDRRIEFQEDREEKIRAQQMKRLRRYAELTQRELSEKSGVPLRTIQQYEQGQKDIGKAAADTVVKIAAALNCRTEELVLTN